VRNLWIAFSVLFLGLLAAPAGAQKNVVANHWAITPSFDGKLYSAFPAGDRPCCYQTAPTLIATDIVSGSTTGGENNKGAYVSLFGYSFGLQSNLGTASGAGVYFQNPDTLAWVEVDNYRALNAGRNFDRNQVERIIVQLGSLGGIAAGKVMSIKVTVNGVDSNILTSRFTVQPGHFYFASNASQPDGTPAGNDGTGVVDDITHPFRYVQNYNAGTNTYSGIWTTLQAGDTIVIRKGTWSDNTGFDNRWVRIQGQTGSAPTGSSGHGYIHIVAYPGPVLGHTQEYVHFVDIPGGGGGIEGATSARAATGAGKYISVSGLHIELNATSISDAAPVNLQNGGDNWRVVDNELGPWLSTTAAPNHARCGGVCGQGAGTPGPYIAFNYIHDIDGINQENHGIYIGDSGGSYNQPSANWEVAYNVIYNIPGGSSLQWHKTVVATYATGMRVHHNYFDTAAKYGINNSNFLQQGDIWDNVVVGSARNAMRIADAIPNLNINITHNTLRQLSSSSAYTQVFSKEVTALTSGNLRFSHNIISTTSGGGSGMSFYGFGASDTAVTVRENLYHDIAGTLTVPSIDSSYGVLGDPLFTDVSAGNFTVQTGSPALAACTQAEPLAVATDFYGIVRPVTGTGTPGATRNDIGAMQGVGQ
jgi:hypothetical protein